MAKKNEIAGIPMWLLAVAAAVGIYVMTKAKKPKSAIEKAIEANRSGAAIDNPDNYGRY
jgi:anthranilate phosphoribosyltransferase